VFPYPDFGVFFPKKYGQSDLLEGTVNRC